MERKKEIILLLIIIIIASFFRLWQLNKVPPGLFPDQAANGLDVVDYIFKGHLNPFFERGQGREGLFFYIQALMIKIFGISVWPMFLASALVGILTIIAAYFLVKSLFNKEVALLTTFFLSTSSWYTTCSRTGFRAITAPLFLTLFFLFSLLALKERGAWKKNIFSAFSGISLGLGFYTYPSFRMVSLILGVIFIAVLIKKRGLFLRYSKELLIIFILALLISLPLIFYFWHHPQYFFGRAKAVSVLNPDLNKGHPLALLLRNVEKTALMFITKGDITWRHNVSGLPMMDPILFPFFLAGLIYSSYFALASFFSKENFTSNLKHLLLVSWFFIMLLPQVLTGESIPHGLRSLGILPVAFVFVALAVYLLKERMPSFRRITLSLLAFILLFDLFWNAYLYFGISALSPDFYYAYRGDLTTVARYINKRDEKETTYLVLDPYSVQTIQFLTYNKGDPYILVEPWDMEKIKAKAGDEVLFTQSTLFDEVDDKTGIVEARGRKRIRDFQSSYPHFRVIKRDYNKFGDEIMRVYEYKK